MTFVDVILFFVLSAWILTREDSRPTPGQRRRAGHGSVGRRHGRRADPHMQRRARTGLRGRGGTGPS